MKIQFWLALYFSFSVAAPLLADDSGPVAGSTATFQTIEEGVSGTATIVDDQTIQLENFYYNGGGISVFFRLGTNNTSTAFANGLTLGDQLVGHVYTNASLTLTLPTGQSVQGYHAISVFCVDVSVNFGSGTFVTPNRPQLDSIVHTKQTTTVLLSGEIGKHYELQTSTNLSTWTDFKLKTNTTGTLIFTDTNQLDERFYRAVVK